MVNRKTVCNIAEIVLLLNSCDTTAELMAVVYNNKDSIQALEPLKRRVYENMLIAKIHNLLW